MTLIELLVVIVIITTIVAAAIPIMSPANDDRRLREASRGLNTFITGAQTRAIASSRPFGIALKRLSQDTDRSDPITSTNTDNDNGVCLEIFYVEQPAPYAGFDANSRACVALHPTRLGLALVRFVTRGTANLTNNDRLPVGWDADLFPTGMIRPYDVIETGGTRFELLPSGNSQLPLLTTDENGYYLPRTDQRPPMVLARPINDSGQLIHVKYDAAGREIGTAEAPPYWTSPAPYKILRQPTPTSDEPYQLPEGTAIDLRASGVGRENYFYFPDDNINVNGVDNAQGVLIMFTPEGRVARVTYSQLPDDNVDDSASFDQPVVDNVFLIVGKRENIPAPAPDNDPSLKPVLATATDEERQKIREPINWLGPAARWVVIGSQSGRVVTIENALVDLPEVTPMPPSEAKRNEQILAAREFTREMAQLGGR